MTPASFETLVVMIFGLIFGSFLNVVIHRVPRRQSIGMARSRCPHCAAEIPWYQNVPVLSYIALRGRCSGCGGSISIRYPLVELVSAGILVLTYLWHDRAPFIPLLVSVMAVLVALLLIQLERRFLPSRRKLPGTYIETHLVVGALTAGGVIVGLSRYMTVSPFLLFGPFAMAMVALFVIDLEHQLLPDVLTISGTICGLILSPWNPLLQSSRPGGWLDSLLTSAAGAGFGFGLLWALATAYEKARGISGLGGGDVKLAAMIGAFGGPESVISVLLIASFAGVIFGFALIAMKRADMQSALPFGCFLTPAAYLVIVLGFDNIFELVPLLMLRALS